ncbi:MAG: radical SAM protein [Candidatus Hydrothermarchaeales archaeon]
MAIRDFDPWKDPLCTCPKKYSLNPYTGCEHRCIYCYMTSYIPNGFNCRVKKGLLKKVRKEGRKLNPSLPISISNSSDPYTPMEEEHRLTRACLRLLKEFKVLIITKSDLVTRDLDLLSDMRAGVSMTITTLDEELAGRLEPYAPPPERRLKALERLIESGMSVSCRIDPIIPRVNEDAGLLIKELSHIGVSQVISSTFKPRYDSWKRFEGTFEEESRTLKDLYFEHGTRHKNAFYLPSEVRFKLMKGVRRLCDKCGMTFSACREGFDLDTAESCDGSHLINTISS